VFHNVVHFRAGFQYTVRTNLTVAAGYNDFWLANRHDGVYAGGKSVARSTSGAAGAHVGQEPDVQAVWTPSRTTQVNAGYGRLFAGEFLKKTTAGVPYSLVLLGVTQRF